MRLRLTVGIFVFAIVCTAQGQWVNPPDPTQDDPSTLAGRAGIGGITHSSARLRITEVPGVVTNGPFHLTFGTTNSLWWGFRLDSSHNLHLDRDSDTGWAEGFVFNRNGNFGIGTDAPQHLFHAVKDQNAGTIMRLSNASNGAAAYTALQYTEGATVKAEIRSIGSGFTTAAGGANAFHLWNYANSPTLFATNNAERMRIFADGNIVVGGTANMGKFGVLSTTDGGRALYAQHRTMIEANANQGDTGMIVQAMNDTPAGVTNSGGIIAAQAEGWNMGPGTVSYVTGGVFRAGNYWGLPGTVSNAFGLQTKVAAGAGTVTIGYGIYVHDTEATTDWGVYQSGANDTNYFAGNVVIGGPDAVAAPHTNNALNVQGNANFNGTVTGTNIKAHYQDVAEWVPSTTDLAPGTVVILNTGRNNEVMASATAYDTTVAGVVSAQPGISLGVEGEGKEQIATTGRVKVRVDARRQSVRVGDLLVTSDTPGTAMRSEPMSVNGRAFHQPGTIIGKALEPLQDGVGEILVLLSMQ